MTRLLPLALIALTGCAAPTYETADETSQRDPDAPGLHVGDRVGDAELWTVDGEPVELSSLWADGPVIITLYRGGWCPFCNRALSDWQGRMDEVSALGIPFVAITPERPDKATSTIDKNGLEYRVLSDYSMSAARAFHVDFSVDPETQTKYKGYGIELSQWNQSGTWQLPAPGTFIVDADGVVRYAWADWDYTKRADPEDVLKTARKLAR